MTVLKIQPGPANSMDTFIAEPAPNNNYKGSEYLIVQGIAPDRYHSLLQFSLALLPIGAAISSAKLYLFPDTLSGSKNIHLSEASQSWDIDTVTWNTRPVPGMKTITKKAVINTWLEFDVLSIIQDWIATPAYNLGFQLVSDLCDNSEVVFYSGDYLADPTKRPYLEIIYTGGYLPNYGDVIGPGGATDSDIVKFDGVTGKLIKDSGIKSSDIITALARLVSSYLFVRRSNPTNEDFVTAAFTYDAAWHNNGLDLSAIVPAGAVAVLLQVRTLSATVQKEISFRQNATAGTDGLYEFYTEVAGNFSGRDQLIVNIDSDRKLDYSTNLVAPRYLGITVLGWFL